MASRIQIGIVCNMQKAFIVSETSSYMFDNSNHQLQAADNKSRRWCFFKRLFHEMSTLSLDLLNSAWDIKSLHSGIWKAFCDKSCQAQFCSEWRSLRSVIQKFCIYLHCESIFNWASMPSCIFESLHCITDLAITFNFRVVALL